MYPDSPYAIPIGSFRNPVTPPSVDANATPLVYIGLNCEWFPYIIGALKQLLLQATWDTNDPNLLNLTQMRVFTLMSLFNCATALNIADLLKGSSGPDESEMMIRQNPDNPCEIQSSIDGTTWCTFIDLSLCFGVPPQPGGGSEQPKPGGCARYHAVLPGNSQWLLPTGVSSGDTIEVQNAIGSTNDGGTAYWYCPDGSRFILGSCTPLTNTSGSNPLPSVPTNKVIALIGSTYYDVLIGSAFTVPGGHANDQVTFQVNNASLSDNAGVDEFDVVVCNNQSGNISIAYSHGSGLTSVPYGTAIVVTAQNIGSDVRFDMTFAQPVKLSVIGQSGYVNVGAPGPGDVWCGWSLGGTQVGTLSDPPATSPTDFPPNQVCDALAMDTGGPGSVFTVTLQLDHP